MVQVQVFSYDFGMNITFFKTSAVKQLITINGIQNKSLCVCVFCVYILYTHIDIENIYMYTYIYIHIVYIINKYILYINIFF